MPAILNNKKKKPFYLTKFNILIFALFLIILVPGYLFFIKPVHHDYQYYKKLFDSYTTQREQNLKLLNSYQQTLNNYQDINISDEDKINAILPDQIEQASLYANLESLVASLDITLDNIAIEVVKQEQTRKPIGAELDESAKDPKANIRYVKISLDLSGVSYLKLKQLLAALENNLRLLDVASFSFDPTEAALTIYLKAYYNQ